MENVRDRLNRVAANTASQIIDVASRRPTCPTERRSSRPMTGCERPREQEARSIRAEGAKRRQIIRAEADAEPPRPMLRASARTRNSTNFYRAMQSYQTTFLGDGQAIPRTTTVVLSPQNDYLKEFTGRGR
jgi:membrane protease subunit HflC